MTIVDYFCYAVRREWLEAQAAAAGWELDGQTGRYFARDLMFEAGLGRKARLHYVWNKHGRFVCIVLASDKSDPRAPDMPVGREPPPEEYEALRVLLKTEKKPRWRKFEV